ncbi:UNVERIFIED_ORG: formate/nitrite transporter FocA (FNT family) [Arthrobacter sp. UYEF10]
MPIAAVVAREASYAQLGKLWGGTLIANLVGGWLFMALIMTAFPQWSGTITLMTRMQHGTDSVTGKIAAAVVGAFLLYGLQLFHSILDSLLIFGAIHAGADIDYW